MIYLDSAATSYHKPEAVGKAVLEALTTMGNPGRGAHEPTLKASRMVYDTRVRLAELFHIGDPSRIAFTSNVTEALNLAIIGLPELRHVITTCSEHNSVLRPLYRRQDQGMDLTILPADAYGRISPEQIRDAIRPDTGAVVIQHGSNLTGNVMDLAAIGAITRSLGILLIVDAAQTAGCIPIHVEAMNIDILCFTGHKSLLGPQGTGGLWVREGLELSPLKVGGSGIRSFDHHHPQDMPLSLEAGTMNVHGLAGLNAALRYLQEVGIPRIHDREMFLCRRFLDGIRDIPQLKIYGSWKAPEAGQELHTPIVTLNLGDQDAAEVSDILWTDYRICVRSGAHCAPLIHEHFGTVDQGAVRFSFSFRNTEEEVDEAIRALHEITGDDL